MYSVHLVSLKHFIRPRQAAGERKAWGGVAVPDEVVDSVVARLDDMEVSWLSSGLVMSCGGCFLARRAPSTDPPLCCSTGRLGAVPYIHT